MTFELFCEGPLSCCRGIRVINFSSNVTVHLFTFKSICLKLSVYMSQVMSWLYSIHIDELVGLEVYPYINGDNLL